MDPKLIAEFRACLSDLQNSILSDSHKGHPQIQQPKFLDGTLYLVTKSDDISPERYNNLLELSGVSPPLLLACRNDSFWQSTEVESEKSFVFVNTRRKTVKSSASSTSDQSSNFGSPMKLDKIADLSIVDDADMSVVPTRKRSVPDCAIPIASGRKLVCLYTSLFCPNDHEVDCNANEKVPTFVAVCNGQNLRSVCALCVQPMLDKQNNLRGLKTTCIQSKAAANKSEQMTIVPRFVQCDVTCEAQYEMEGSALTLQFQWRMLSDQACVPLHEPPIDARSVVKMSVTVDNTRSPAFCLFKELEILHSIIKGINTTEVHWVGFQERPLVDEVRELIGQLKLGSDVIKNQFEDAEKQEGDQREESMSENFNTSLSEERKDLDFTDHLWKILQNCTSISDLLETFRHILSVLREGDLQPYVHRHNSSTVAGMVRDSYRGQLRSVSLAGVAPLEYLAEMGIHKLTQDYINVFLSRNLVTFDSFNHFTRNNLSLEEKWQFLVRLQRTLEVVILLKQCLDLPVSTLSDSCKAMFKHYESHGVDPNHQFVFCVPTPAVASIPETCPPTKWKAEGVKLVEGIAQRMVYSFSREQPFDWLNNESSWSMNGHGSGSSGDGDSTYCLTIIEDSVSVLQ